jgi:3-oxoadipate enol-lactonase
MISELLRTSARDLAEAGRELGRFDSRPWIASLRAPAAVVVTTRDTVVLPHKQRSLAAQLGARVIEAPIEHLEVIGRKFNALLLAAIDAVVGDRPGMAVR